MVYFLLLFCLNVAMADEQSEAIDHSIKAALTYPEVKQKVKFLEDQMLQFSPLEKNTTKNVLVTALILVKGKVSTDKFKMFTYKFENGYVRPDTTYNFRNTETIITIAYKLEFP